MVPSTQGFDSEGGGGGGGGGGWDFPLLRHVSAATFDNLYIVYKQLSPGCQKS